MKSLLTLMALALLAGCLARGNIAIDTMPETVEEGYFRLNDKSGNDRLIYCPRQPETGPMVRCGLSGDKCFDVRR